MSSVPPPLSLNAILKTTVRTSLHYCTKYTSQTIINAWVNIREDLLYRLLDIFYTTECTNSGSRHQFNLLSNKNRCSSRQALPFLLPSEEKTDTCTSSCETRSASFSHSLKWRSRKSLRLQTVKKETYL